MRTVRSWAGAVLAFFAMAGLGCNNSRPSHPPEVDTNKTAAWGNATEADEVRRGESALPFAATVGKDEQPLIVVTSKAAATVNQIVKDQGITDTWYIRVRLVPGGCKGFMHQMGLETAPEFATDHTFESGGLKVVVLKRQVEMLQGTRLDFGREQEQEGFIIKSPNFEGEALKKWLPVLLASHGVQ